jgi:hypothetical protein
MPRKITAEDIQLVWHTYEQVHGVQEITTQEAFIGARKLYRTATGETWTGVCVLAKGKAPTQIKDGTFIVNRSKGWREMCCDIAHDLTWGMAPEWEPADTDYEQWCLNVYMLLSRRVCEGNWLVGALKPEPKAKLAPPSKDEKRRAKIEALEERLARWQKKALRARTAIVKINRSLRAYKRNK